MNTFAFRAAFRSAASASTRSTGRTSARLWPLSLGQTARLYSSHTTHESVASVSHSTKGNSDTAWVIGSLLIFGPLIYTLTAPPPKAKKTDHHPAAAHTESIEEKPAEAAAEAKTVAVSPIVEKLPNDYFPYILIGAGTASFAAMEAIREKDPNAAILIIGEEDSEPYMRPPLSKEMWFNKSEETTEKLSFKDWQGKERNIVLQGKEKIVATTLDEIEAGAYTEAGVKLLKGFKVVDLEVGEQRLRLNNGKVLKYGKVLLATGGVPKKLTVLQAVGSDKVTTFRSVKDFQKLHELVKSTGKTIVVVGGGFLGSELSVAIANYGKDKDVKVTQIFPEDGNMGLVFPRYLSKWTTSQIENEGVTVKAGCKIASSKAVDHQVELVLENGEKVVADHVVVAVGLQANIDLAEKAGLELDDVRGGVVVNAELQARRNVYCAGDMSSYHDVTLGRRRVEHYDNAVLGGRVAGQNMVSDGLHKPYKHQSMFWSDLGPHIGYEAVGILDSKLSTISIWTKKPAATAAAETPSKAATTDTVMIANKEAPVIATIAERATATPVPAELIKVEDQEKYKKGLVLYLKDKKIVGLLMWNNFGKVDEARKILGQVYETEKIEALVKPFGIHEE